MQPPASPDVTEKTTGTYLPVNERNLTIKRLTSKHACDSEIRQSNWAMSGYRKNGDRWTCSCGQAYAFANDEAEGGGWWPQNDQAMRPEASNE